MKNHINFHHNLSLFSHQFERVDEVRQKFDHLSEEKKRKFEFFSCFVKLSVYAGSVQDVWMRKIDLIGGLVEIGFYLKDASVDTVGAQKTGFADFHSHRTDRGFQGMPH